MPTLSPTGLNQAILDLIAMCVLLLTFVMLGSHWIRNHILAFAAQSWVLALLSAFIGFSGHYPALLVIAGLTLLFRGLILPHLLVRILDRAHLNREFAPVVQSAMSVVMGALCVLLAYGAALRLGQAVTGQSPVTPVMRIGLTSLLAVVLIGFLMLVLRREAVSHLLGLLVIENGIFLGSLILMPGLPLLLEFVVLFDLLLIVVALGMFVRYLRAEIGSTDSRALDRLVG